MMIRVEQDVVDGENDDQEMSWLMGRTKHPDMLHRLFEVKRLVENNQDLTQLAVGGRLQSDEQSGEYYDEENRYKIEFAVHKLESVDKLVNDFVRACNKDDFLFGLIVNRDKIVFDNLCRKDQKTLEDCLYKIIRKQQSEYDEKLEHLEDKINHFNLNAQIQDFKIKQARRHNPLSLNSDMKQILEQPLDESTLPTNIKELEELEKIVDESGQTPTIRNMINVQNKLDMELKRNRKRVVKMLKIVSNVTAVHPTLVSVNKNNMISQRQPHTDPIDNTLAAEYHTSETSKWKNWSNSSFYWKKVLDSLDISTALEVFVSREYVDNINQEKISSLVHDVSQQMTDVYTTLDPADPETVAALVKRARHQFGEMLSSSDVQTLVKEKEDENRQTFLATVNKTEITVLNKCYSKVQAIVAKQSSFFESQIRLFIKYSFTGQFIPYIARSAYIDKDQYWNEGEEEHDADYLFPSLLLKKSTYVIPEPDTIMVVRYKRTKQYAGYYLPTNTPLNFVVNEDNGRLSEQLLSLEIQHAGMTARIEDTVKQKPFIIVERKSDKEVSSSNGGKITDRDTNYPITSGVGGGHDANTSQTNIRTKGAKKRKLVDDVWYIEGDDHNHGVPLHDSLMDQHDRKYAKRDEHELDNEINRIRKKILDHKDDTVNNPKIYRPSIRTVTGENPLVYTLRNKPKAALSGSGKKGGGKGSNSKGGDKLTQMKLPPAPSGSRPLFQQRYDTTWNYRDTRMAETGRPSFNFMMDAEKRDAEMKHKMLMLQEKRWSEYEDMLIKNKQKEDSENRVFLKKVADIKSSRKADLGRINEHLKKLQSALTSKAEMEEAQTGLLDAKPLLDIIHSGFGDMDKMYKQMIEQIRKIGIDLNESDSNDDGQSKVFVEFNNRIDMALALQTEMTEQRLLDMQTMYKQTEDNIRQMLRSVSKASGQASGDTNSQKSREKAAMIGGCYDDDTLLSGVADIDIYQPTVDTRTTEMTDKEFEYELGLKMTDMRVIQDGSDNEDNCGFRKPKKNERNGKRGKKGLKSSNSATKKKRVIPANTIGNMIDKDAYDELEVSLKNMDAFCNKLVDTLRFSIDNYNKSVAKQSSNELKLEMQDKKIRTYENLITFFSNQLKTQIEANKTEIRAFQYKFSAFTDGVSKHLQKRLERTQKQDNKI